MKKLLFTLAALFVSSFMMGQTITENYTKTTSYRVKTLNGTADAVSGATLTNDNKIENTTYFDGLGRPKQSIGIRAGGGRQDIITHVEYDQFGRQDKEYLPYSDGITNGGYIRPNALDGTNNYYITNYGDEINTSNPNPYSQKLFEASPMNRVLKQGAPGKDWQTTAIGGYSYSDHGIESDYQTNLANEVKSYSVEFENGDSEKPIIVLNGFYEQGQLYKNIVRDENHSGYPSLKNNTIEEFKNKQGQVVLKRTYNNSIAHDTYYVYDDFGNLTYVIPPLASEQLFSGGTSEPYSISFPQSAFTGTSYGGGSVAVAINGDQIVVTFNASFISNTLNGTPQNLNAPCALPNMYLGQLQTTPSSPISASIENGYLKLTNTYNIAISGINCVLTKTFSPSCSGSTLNTDILNNLCYQYKYDHRNRLIEKKIPGKGTATDWEEIVYNKLDQPILTRDPNLKNTGKWLFTKYDVFGRVAYTGLITNSNSRATLQTAADLVSSQFVTKNTATIIVGTTIYYNNGAYPILVGTDEIQTINYYDDYNFGVPAIPVNRNYTDSITTRTKGLATGSKAKVLGQTNIWITTTSYYDDKARPIYAKSINEYLGTTDIVESKLDFVGNVEKTKTTHTKTGQLEPIETEDTFVYDHVGRLKSQTQTINGVNSETIVANTYDELGQLITKGVGGKTSRLQTVNYAYNIRGWLKQINDPASLGTDLFGFKINYNTTVISGSTPLYNGNISETIWKTKNDEVSSTPWLHRAYSYQYDPLNRIIKGDYKIRNSSGVYGTSNYSEYSLSNVTYDKNGNIGTLRRYTNSGYYPMDDLIYTYDTGNKLLKVVDNGYATVKDQGFKDGTNTGNDYTYDPNGNMLKDLNKAMTSNILYNHLNLPTKVTMAAGNISYIYDATGVKLRKIVSTGPTTDYAGNYVYENGALQFFNTAEGYVEPVNASDYKLGFNYVYQYKDHLGNIRLSYSDKNKNGVILVSTDLSLTEIVEENNYYPFGLKHEGYNNAKGAMRNHKFGFGNKEEQDDNLSGSQLNWLDFGARNYEPALGRFLNIDRFSEKYYHLNPYQYGANNPIIFNDIKGDSILIYSKQDKTYLKYNNGNLYSRNTKTSNWETYSGKSVKVDKNGNKTIGGFLGKAVAALDNIRNGGTSGNELVGTIQNDSKYVRINEGSNSSSGVAGGVNWNDSNQDAAGNSRPSYIGLAHELGHALDGLDGVMNYSTIGVIGGKNIPGNELTSMHWENQIRGENGFTLRQNYGMGDSGQVVGQNVNQSGQSLHFNKQLVTPSVSLQSQYSSSGIGTVVMIPGKTTILIPYQY